MDARPTLFTLYIDPICVARDDLIVLDNNSVLRPGLNHNSTRLEVLEFGAVDLYVGVHGDDSGCASVICCIALELAVVYLETGAFKHRYARHLSVRFTEYSTKRQI